MILRKLLAASALSAMALTAAPALAQTPGLQVGTVVKDTQGGEVGTITAINGPNVILHTDRFDAAVPATSIALDNGQALFGMTREQLNAAVEQTNAQAQAAFAIGTQVKDRDGAVVGPVQALDAETVTVQFGDRQVRLPRNALAAGNGGLVTGATVAELQAAVGSGTQ